MAGNKKMRNVLAVILTVVFMMPVFSMPVFPTSVFAEETHDNQVPVQAEGVSTDAIYQEVLLIVSQGLTEDTCVYGNEWAVMTVARAGMLTGEQETAYYKSLEAAVEELGSGTLDTLYPTTNAKVVLALSAMGKNPSDVAGYNLLEPLADKNYIAEQGVNAAIYALLAFDANQYEIPTAPAGAEQVTREDLVQMILEAECSEGGWAWSDEQADPDLSSNALQALAPYYQTDGAVKEAVDRGLTVLSNMQNPDGSVSSWGTENACSTAQVLTALTCLGIDPVTDTRFIKNGYSIMDALGSFYLTGSGFRFDFSTTDVDLPFSTVQASYALVSYERFRRGQNSLYNMSDAFQTGQVPATPDADPAVKKDSSLATGEGAFLMLLLALAVVMLAGGMIMLRKKRR